MVVVVKYWLTHRELHVHTYSTVQLIIVNNSKYDDTTKTKMQQAHTTEVAAILEDAPVAIVAIINFL